MKEKLPKIHVICESEYLNIRISRRLPPEEVAEVLYGVIHWNQSIVEREARPPAKQGNLADQIREALRSGPVLSSGDLCKQLGCDRKSLMRPLLRLVEQEKVIRTGKKRGTKYHWNTKPKLTLARAS